MSQQSLFKQVSELRKQSKAPEALELLRNALSRQQLDAEGIEKAGRIIHVLLAGMTDKPATRVLLLGQCTTSWLANTLTAVAWGQGSALMVSEGAYDNVIQELLATSPDEGKPDVVVLVPWNQRLLFDDDNRSPARRVDDECAFWQQAWKLVRERLGARILQVGYDWITPGALGHCLGARADGNVALVRRVNDALRESLPGGAYFADLEQISGIMGRERFYDLRRYYWTKQPFSEPGTVRLSEHLWAGIRAMLTGPKKVLVLDLDNTLWGGVVGETGPLGIELGEGPDGEAYRAFQKHVKSLSKRGVVLAVCSKNNPADARGPFVENPAMVLSLDDFAHFEASWEPKVQGLKRIAKTLQLGLDSFVFFDDNPAEGELIRQALPEVEVIEVTDPSEYIRALERGLWFETVGLTEEDRQRVGQYRAENQRRDAADSFESIDGYLASLDMVGEVRPIDEADFDRVVQLIGKTNQFNLTTRCHNAEQVRHMLAHPATIGLTLRMVDRFGDYGLVSVILAVEDKARSDGLRIDTWLMSCRVISRTAEEFFFNTLVEEARRRGTRRLIGEYIPTAKNGLVKDLYTRLGFAPAKAGSNGTQVYELELEKASLGKTFVQGMMTAAR
jgi:FkbH-like protein